jgi:ribosome biogenesis GTPase / thiamine phosphate phosphatase
LVAAESFRIPTVLIFNKLDLLNDEQVVYQQELTQLYESLNYPCLFTSAIDGNGVTEFHNVLRGKVSLIAGHSGVGKSTLVNAIAPNLDLRTSNVSTFANKGVHTTTFAEMFEIDAETFIIDSPGIKELGLADIQKEEISHYFPEMLELINQCRFNNCLHLDEPNCAIKDAVMDGMIAQSRYFSYLSMMDGGDNRK